MEKGVIISLDAMIAALVLIVILSLSAFYLGQVQITEKNNILLKEKTTDVLTVLEKNGELERAVQNNKVNQLRVYMNLLPNSLCLDLGIYSETDFSNPELSLLKPGCKKNYSNSATFNRSFLVQNGVNTDFYIARLTTWYKVAE